MGIGNLDWKTFKKKKLLFKCSKKKKINFEVKQTHHFVTLYNAILYDIKACRENISRHDVELCCAVLLLVII